MREQDGTGVGTGVDTSVETDLDSVLEALLAFEASVHRQEVDQLRRALVTNRRIGMAMGVLMGVRHVGEDQAWELLRKASRDSNRKLRDVADDVVRTGTLPDR